MADRPGKRSRAQFEEGEDRNDDASTETAGVGSTLAYLKNTELSTIVKPPSPSPEETENREHSPVDGDWTMVSNKKKRPKTKRRKKEDIPEEEGARKNGKGQSNYPELIYSDLHKLHHMTSLGDLQALLLYCLADGTAPQFVSVRHHANVKKAVVLLVPGLERGIFDGSIALPVPDAASASSEEVNGSHDPANEVQGANPDAAEAESKTNGSESQAHVATQTAEHIGSYDYNDTPSPDVFMPITLHSSKLPRSLQPLADAFVHMWPVKAPGDERNQRVHSPLHHMLTAPIPKTAEEKAAAKNIKGAKPPVGGKYWENVPTPITTFLASKEQLRENDYTLHPAAYESEEERTLAFERRKAAKESAEDGWVDTNVKNLEDGDIPQNSIPKGSLTANRTIYAMDCEMCTIEGGEAALTRISLVSWDGNVVIDSLVNPSKPIIDYLTPYSGITPTALAPITTTLSDIQTQLLALLTPTTIIIGHSLNSDLTALKLTHPFIIDTSLLYPHPRGPPLKSSLKWLSQKYLSREIQKGHGATGHDSIEDARACLDLVRMKCEKGPLWGSQDADRESIFKRLARVPNAGAVTADAHGTNGGKLGAIVDHGAPEKNFGQMAAYCIPCTTDAEVVSGIHRAVHGDPDGAYIPGGGVDFIWARFRELESLRGWSNDNRNPSTSSQPREDPSPEKLSAAVEQVSQQIKAVHDSLPPCTLLMVYSGTGDPRELARLQEMQRTFKREYAVKKWDDLSVRWTDREEQALKRACKVAREGVGFLCVKSKGDDGGSMG